MSEQAGPTYRVQLRPGFGFDEAAEIVDYLDRLGVEFLYCSPVLEAVGGSEHGYDVVDPRRVRDELGGEEGFGRLLRALRDRGMRCLLDVVPNHMAIASRENPWWWDVLENGPASPCAGHFDVEWPEGVPAEEDHGAPVPPPHAVLLPLLPTHYGRVLEDRGIRLARESERFVVRIEGHVLPASPRSIGHLLERAAARAETEAGRELAFLGDALAELPYPSATDRASVARRERDRAVLAARLGALLAGDPSAGASVDETIEELNDDVEGLDVFMARQNYRLASWRMAAEDLGYRRFFHINELIALRTEDPEVFADTHERVLGWLRSGAVAGVRVDHPDGLRDPEEYFQRLRSHAPEAWILAEKILEPDERLRDSWEVDGTTGYDFLNRVGGLYVDPAGEESLTALYADFTRETPDFEEVRRECRARACTDLLGSDLNRLTELFRRVTDRHRRHRDHTRTELRDALLEAATHFPVYRSYVRAECGRMDAEDVRVVERAVASAGRARPDLHPDPLELLESVLLLRVRGVLETELVMRFQQFTGPVAAKGVEDTALYRYNRFVALNEVGGDPSRFGTSLEEFHREALAVQDRRPHTLLTTSTHDTKRGEDVRARLALLSEIPDRWASAVRRWSERNSRHRQGGLPDRNLEYLCYQTLVGTWPIGVDRLEAYLEKAAREAGVHTSWTDPALRYEEAVRGFARGILEDAPFVAELEAFVEPLVHPGRINGLAQTLVRLTAPGVPDLYQGCELWDLSLVDPDNRRPVDFPRRARLLEEAEGSSPDGLLARADDGLPKLHVLREGLRLRRERPAAFRAGGDYRPLRAHGARASHVVAFTRGGSVATVTPRWVLGLGSDWKDTALDLPEGRWRDRLTGLDHSGGANPMDVLLARFPVALLERSEPA